MVLPRQALIAIVGGVLILGAFMASRGLGGPATDDEAVTPLPRTDPAAARSGAPAPVRSGRLRMSIGVSELKGAPDGRDSVRAELSGRFQGNGPATPSFDLELEFEGTRVQVVSTGDRGFVRLGGTFYSIPDEVWAQLSDVRSQLAGDPAASLDPGRWLRGERTAGEEAVDGVPSVHRTGSIDVERVARDFARIGRGDLDADAKELLALLPEVVSRSRVDLYEGAEDGILRRFRLVSDLRVPRESRGRTEGLQSGKLEFSLELSQVNRPQSIRAPSGAAPLGPEQASNSQALPAATAVAAVAIGTIEAETAAAAAPAEKPAPKAQAGDGLPPRVARALARKQVVVLLFTQNGADDEATREAVNALRGTRGVTVVTDELARIGEYERVVSALDITQAPATVIVRPDATAELIEGFTDAGSLAQRVRDAR